MQQFITVTVSLGIIGVIIWWFFGKRETSTATAEQANGVQRVQIVVDGGYRPEVVQLKAGIAAEVTFLRKTSSSCFDEVLLPDFGKQAKLTVNEPYTFKLNPNKVGSFTYSCGMHMFFGKIEVIS